MYVLLSPLHNFPTNAYTLQSNHTAKRTTAAFGLIWTPPDWVSPATKTSSASSSGSSSSSRILKQVRRHVILDFGLRHDTDMI